MFNILYFSIIHQATLAFTGIFSNIIFNTITWIPISTYLVVGPCLWIVHWSGHQRWIWNRWYKSHTIEHHIKIYPPSKLLSDKYISVNNLLNLNILLYLPIPLFNLFVHMLFCDLNNYNNILIIIVGYMIIIEQEIIHRSVHMKGHFLENYTWFKFIRKLHFIHHQGDFKRNYAMIDFCIDLLTGNLINTM